MTSCLAQTPFTMLAGLSFFRGSDLLLFLGVLLIILWLFMRLRKGRRRRALEPTPQEKVERVRQLRGMRGDLEDVMVEIEQLAKRFGAQLDAKTMQLEGLLREADQKISALRQIQDEAPSGAPESELPVEAEAPQIPDDPLARSVYQLADDGIEPADIASQLGEHIGKVELILALRTA